VEEISGLVGVIANDFARVSAFTSSISYLMRYGMPEGANIEYLIGGDWCGARNTLVEMTLDSDAEWLWYMDDDHVFGPDLLLKLLQKDKPLTVPVCLMRTPPFQPVTFVERNKENKFQYLPAYMPDMPAEGLIELQAGGCAGMLIRREVLEAIEPPWFEYTDRSEDIVFCEKAKEAGFNIYCDLSARLGHVTTAFVWPSTNQDGDWFVGLTIGGKMDLLIPFAENEVI
jgi:GT2 family glycosyltransferase